MILQISKSGEHTLPDVDEPDGGVIPVPSYIRPVLCKYRIEVNNLWPMVYMLNTKKAGIHFITILMKAHCIAQLNKSLHSVRQIVRFVCLQPFHTLTVKTLFVFGFMVVSHLNPKAIIIHENHLWTIDFISSWETPKLPHTHNYYIFIVFF